MEVSIGLAFVAGLISFVSPCVLALLPVYLAFLGDASVATAGTAPAPGPRRSAVLPQAVLFVSAPRPSKGVAPRAQSGRWMRAGVLEAGNAGVVLGGWGAW